jgi:hypothetical protein
MKERFIAAQYAASSLVVKTHVAMMPTYAVSSDRTLLDFARSALVTLGSRLAQICWVDSFTVLEAYV